MTKVMEVAQVGEPPVDPEAEAKAFFETEMHPLVYPTCYLSCHQAGGRIGRVRTLC